MHHLLKEKRHSSRSRVFLGGEIIFDAQIPSVECHVKNISRDGANISVQSGELIPDRFELFVRKTGQRHHAVVKHSKGRQLGLAYVDAPNANRKWASVSELRKVSVSS